MSWTTVIWSITAGICLSLAAVNLMAWIRSRDDRVYLLSAIAADELLGLDGFINILTNLNYPRKPLKMDALELALLKFSNDIRLQDDITIIEGRYSG